MICSYPVLRIGRVEIERSEQPVGDYITFRITQHLDASWSGIIPLVTWPGHE